MKVMNKFVVAAMLTVAAGVAGLTSAGAATYDWNFTPLSDGVLASSVTYTNGAPPLSAVATGYTNNGFGTTTALYGKVDGGDENGIGINSDPLNDHEIWGSTHNSGHAPYRFIRIFRLKLVARPTVKPIPFGAPPLQQQVDTASLYLTAPSITACSLSRRFAQHATISTSASAQTL